jgi:NADPH:quinone reductase-like Zn-dependent oxidoreductase
LGPIAPSLEDGEFRAVVDRHYPVEEIADAYRYVETGRKTGIVVIDIMTSGED